MADLALLQKLLGKNLGAQSSSTDDFLNPAQPQIGAVSDIPDAPPRAVPRPIITDAPPRAVPRPGGAATASANDDMSQVQLEDLPTENMALTPDLPVSTSYPAMSGTPKEKLLRGMIEQQMANEIQQRGQDVAINRQALAQEANKSAFDKMDLSPIMQLANIAGASAQDTAGYKAPVSKEKELRDALEKAREGLSTSQSGFLKNQLEHQQAQQGRNDLMQQRLIMTYSDKMGQALDPYKASPSSAFGRAAGKVQAADALTVLAEQVPDLNFNNQQMTELATSSAKLLSGGGSLAQSQIEHLLPKTVGSSAAGILNWLTNDPHGTDQREFARVMLDTAARERDLAANQIYEAQKSRLPQFSKFGKVAPEEYNLIKNAHVIPPRKTVKESVADIRKSHSPGGMKTAVASKHPTNDQINSMSAEELKAYLGAQ